LEEVADQMGITPRELLASGFADALAPADPAALTAWCAARLETLHQLPQEQRLKTRTERWLNPLPGSPRTAAPEPPDIG
jgi:hypothetical protein